MLEEVMNDRSYVPMKAKELAMLLGIPKSQRDELAQVLDYLVSEGRIGISITGRSSRSRSMVAVPPREIMTS